MNDGRLSSSTKALLATAKADAPSAAARAKVWAGVSSAIGGVAAVGASQGPAGAGGSASAASAAKMLALGTLLGGTVTVGLALTLLYVGPVPAVPTAPRAQVAAAAAPVEPAAPKSAINSSNGKAGTKSAITNAGTVLITGTSVARPKSSAHASGVDREDALAREASLVAKARAALAGGEPSSALNAIRAARALPSQQLRPEELAVEAQALRALGREEEANAIDSTLRSHYPESALGR